VILTLSDLERLSEAKYPMTWNIAWPLWASCSQLCTTSK